MTNQCTRGGDTRPPIIRPTRQIILSSDVKFSYAFKNRLAPAAWVMSSVDMTPPALDGFLPLTAPRTSLLCKFGRDCVSPPLDAVPTFPPGMRQPDAVAQQMPMEPVKFISPSLGKRPLCPLEREQWSDTSFHEFRSVAEWCLEEASMDIRVPRPPCLPDSLAEIFVTTTCC